jgi:hypothetical protein
MLETMLAVGVVGIMTLSVASFGTFMTSFNRAETQKTVVYDYKEELITSLSSPGYWDSIVAGAGVERHPTLNVPLNPELACVRNGTLCTEGTYNLTVISPTKVIRFDALNTAAGFDSRGSLCVGFNKDERDPLLRCPYRYEVKWTPVCDLGITQCANPLIRISAQLVLNRAIDLATNITVANLSFYVATDIIADPIPKSTLALTNSTVLNFGTSLLTFDMMNAVTYAGPASALRFSSASGLSTMGGTVTFTQQTLKYTPPPGYYGRDQILYVVKGPSNTAVNGIVDVGVMTPHTWLGPVGGGPTGKTSTASNFCGKVVNSICDRASFTAMPDIHFVFNDLCVSCDAIFDSTSASVATLELADTYTDKVVYSGSASVQARTGGIWDKHPVFSQKNGKFEPDTVTASFSTLNKYGAGSVHNTLNEKAFSVTGGKFTGTRSPNGVSVVGGVEIVAGTYIHNNGIFNLYSFFDGAANVAPNLEHLNVINAPGTDFYDFKFNGSGTPLADKVGISVQASFNIKNNLYLNPMNEDNGVASYDYDTFCTWEGGAQVAGSYSSGVNAIAITVEKDIFLTGYGGKGSRIGCKSPQIKFRGGGMHTITSTPTAPATVPVINTKNFFGLNGGDFATMQAFVNKGAPHMPFLMVDDASVSIKFIGPIGFRRGLVNKSDSNLDFSASTLVFGNTDLGDVTFTPESKPAAIKNPTQDVYFRNIGGGKMIIGSRQLRIGGKLYSLFDKQTAVMGDGVGGALTEMHIDGDFVAGYGQNFKDAPSITYPVTALFDGTTEQWISGTGYDWFPTSEMPYNLVVNKPTSKLIFSEGLILQRDVEILSAAIGSGSSSAGASWTIPDSGDNNFVHTIKVVPVSYTIPGLYINHNVKIPNSISAGLEVGYGGMTIGRSNTHTTKTIEMGAGVDIRTRRLQIYSDQQASAPDKPFRVVGGNPLKFRMLAYSYLYDYQTNVGTTAPGTTTMDIPNMHVETVNPGAGWGRIQHFFSGRLKLESYKAGNQVAVCLNAPSTLEVNTVTVGVSAGLLWNSGLFTKNTAVVDPSGVLTSTNGAYDCSGHSPRWQTGTMPYM